MRTLRLQAVATVSFHKTVRTNYLEWRSKNREFAASLKRGDCIMMRSVGGRSIAFVYGFIGVDDDKGITHAAFVHERVDLDDGERFDEYMIANYAARVGIKLEGIRRLEEHFKWLSSDEYVSPVLAERALRKAS